MTIIQSSNINEVKNLIKRKETSKPIIIRAQSDIFNRKILEFGHFNILLGIEKGNKKRSIRQIDSGFNEILAKIATKNKIALGIDLDEIRKMNKKEKAIYLEKAEQNIKIARKYKTKIALLNMKDKKDASSFLFSFGASTKQTKKAIEQAF